MELFTPYAKSITPAAASSSMSRNASSRSARLSGTVRPRLTRNSGGLGGLRRADRVHRLDPEADVFDPVGASAEVFGECADRIERAVDRRMEMILEAAAE